MPIKQFHETGHKNCHSYHGFMKLGTKNSPVSLVFLARTSTCSKRVCTFCKKKNVMYYGVFTNLQKNFFSSFKKCETNTFFFFPIWWFFKKSEEKKHKFHFQIAKFLNFMHQKNMFFCKFTLVHRHFLNSRETVRSFTGVSLKLTWNSKNGQSFTETGCQKYVVFGMKSAKSTVSKLNHL